MYYRGPPHVQVKLFICIPQVLGYKPRLEQNNSPIISTRITKHNQLITKLLQFDSTTQLVADTLRYISKVNGRLEIIWIWSWPDLRNYLRKILAGLSKTTRHLRLAGSRIDWPSTKRSSSSTCISP